MVKMPLFISVSSLYSPFLRKKTCMSKIPHSLQSSNGVFTFFQLVDALSSLLPSMRCFSLKANKAMVTGLKRFLTWWRHDSSLLN
ncbi:hypothetical protein VNO77_41429 [Canavalia gladiata]|uniref:Uncharacterized protein n=1 Tax=Canavalia gladiata TaxID=3824 RepID=A0AAN9K0T5_CANGL